MEAQWTALGTSVVLRVTDPQALDPARAVVEADLDRVDSACSRFRADSDLSRVNANPGRLIPVDRLLLEAIDVALRAARLTDGDVDPALGAALVLAGYDRDWDLIARDEPTATVGTVPRSVHAHVQAGWRTIEVDRERAMVRVPSGVQLDLGATAKAWAADRAAHAAHAATGSGVLVSLGGDIATAGQAPERGWPVHVTDDHRAVPGANGQTITIRAGGIATSSTTVRRWTRGETTMHHILDPRTGAPTHGAWRTVSVAAADCTDANIASTAAIVRGSDAVAWLEERGLPARLIGRDGRVVRVAGWPEEASKAPVAA
jgi:thiamine biosynthesis lipoprotein